MLSGELLNLSAHRKVAKIGMSVTLATSCITAIGMKNSSMRKLHTISSIAFVGFALYHAGLYDNGIFKNMIINAQKNQAVKKRIENTKKS